MNNNEIHLVCFGKMENHLEIQKEKVSGTMDMYIICKKCGTDYSDKLNVCPNCHTRKIFNIKKSDKLMLAVLIIIVIAIIVTLILLPSSETLENYRPHDYEPPENYEVYRYSQIENAITIGFETIIVSLEGMIESG